MSPSVDPIPHSSGQSQASATVGRSRAPIQSLAESDGRYVETYSLQRSAVRYIQINNYNR